MLHTLYTHLSTSTDRSSGSFSTPTHQNQNHKTVRRAAAAGDRSHSQSMESKERNKINCCPTDHPQHLLSPREGGVEVRATSSGLSYFVFLTVSSEPTMPQLPQTGRSTWEVKHFRNAAAAWPTAPANIRHRQYIIQLHQRRKR